MSEKNKPVKVINERIRLLVVGSFWVLLAVVIMLAMGKVGRTLAFPLIYLFGASYYFFAGLIAIAGIVTMFRSDKQPKKNPPFIIGMVFLLLAAIMLTGVILMNNAAYKEEVSYATSIKDLLSNFHGDIKEYYKVSKLNLFDSNSYYNTGIVGLLIGGMFGSNQITMTMGIVFAVVGFFFVSIRPLVYLVTAIKKKSKFEKGKQKARRVAEKEEEIIIPVPVPEPEPETRYRPIIEKEPEVGLDIFETEDDVEIDIPVGFEVEEEEIRNEGPGFSKTFMNGEEDFMDMKEDEEFRKLSLDDEDDDKINTYESYVEPVKDDVVEKKDDNLYDDSFVENEEIYLSDDDLYDGMKEESKEVVAQPAPFIPAPTPAPAPQPAPAPTPEMPIPAPAPIVVPPVEEKPKKRERVEWIPPSSELLDVYETAKAIEINSAAADERVEIINQVLEDFKIRARCSSYTIGSSVTRYNIEYEPGVSVSLIDKRVTDIALKLNGANCRFTPLVQGESFSGLEVPNPEVTTVSFKEVFEALPPASKEPLSVGFGKDISGNVVAACFDEFPHLLVAGTTGSGKSIYIHSIIATLIMRNSPDDLKIVLVDPKKVEMTKYRDMPHLLTPIITEASKARVMLSKLVDEMNDRYGKFAIADSCSNIKQYNAWAKEHNEELMPYIIIVLDEYADLVDTCKEISQPVVSIAQKARAAGIHLLISTQRPSTNVITGVIKGNLPTHVALMTSSAVDSMTILGEGGAEKLLGKGDMLVQSPLVSRVGCVRLQGCFIHNREIGRVVSYLKEKYETRYDEKFMDLVDHASEAGAMKVASGEVVREADAAEEEKYQEIKAWVMTQKFVSMSRIQRECFVGFNRAGRFFNRLQKEGVVSTETDGSNKGCKVLIHDDYDDGDYTPVSDELIS